MSTSVPAAGAVANRLRRRDSKLVAERPWGAWLRQLRFPRLAGRRMGGWAGGVGASGLVGWGGLGGHTKRMACRATSGLSEEGTKFQ